MMKRDKQEKSYTDKDRKQTLQLSSNSQDHFCWRKWKAKSSETCAQIGGILLPKVKSSYRV